MASEKVDTVVLLDTQDCPGYTYEELPTPTSVRLISALRLELVDGLPLVDTTHGTMTAVLSFSLRTVDLATKPSYDCLSYTWGRPGRVFTSKAVHDSSEEYYSQRSAVLCDGKLLWIGRNLFIFFQRLLGAENLPQRFKDEHSFRHLCGRDRSDSLWIDQICINQEDIGERGRQVQIMDRIYRNANIVIAWLGEEDSYSKAALYGLHGLASLKQDMADQARGLSPIHSDLAPLGLSGKLAYTAVYAFLKRSWVSFPFFFFVFQARPPSICCTN